MKTAKLAFAPFLVVGSLLILVFGCPAHADDLPWVYDTSRRVEPMPSETTSPAGCLDAKAQDVGLGSTDWFSSVFLSEATSPGSDLSSIPLGFFLFFR